MNIMKDWFKGLILLVLGNVFYNVIPVWTTQYLLSLPNPLYSIGAFLQSLPSLNLGTYSSSLEAIKQVVGFAIICYALYLISKSFYKR